MRERQLESRAARGVHRQIIEVAAALLAITVVSVLAIALIRSDELEGGQVERATSGPDAISEAKGDALTERGNIPKEMGEIAGFGPANSPAQNTFRIDRIVVDPPCHPGRTRPRSEHTVLLHITVKTGDDGERAAMLGRILQPGFFSAVGREGEAHDAWPGTCTDPSKYLREELGRNQMLSGTVELRLPAASGILILSGALDNAAGWEWRF